MSIFQTLFNLFLTSIGGSASFHIGRVNIGVATISGTPELVLSLGTQPSSLPPVTTTTTTSSTSPA